MAISGRYWYGFARSPHETDKDAWQNLRSSQNRRRFATLKRLAETESSEPWFAETDRFTVLPARICAEQANEYQAYICENAESTLMGIDNKEPHQ